MTAKQRGLDREQEPQFEHEQELERDRQQEPQLEREQEPQCGRGIRLGVVDTSVGDSRGLDHASSKPSLSIYIPSSFSHASDLICKVSHLQVS